MKSEPRGPGEVFQRGGGGLHGEGGGERGEDAAWSWRRAVKTWQGRGCRLPQDPAPAGNTPG